MLQLSRLPQNVSYFLRGTQHFFRFRHHLVFNWTLILLLVYQDSPFKVVRIVSNSLISGH